MNLIQGDLFKIYKKYDIIVHGCNCQSVMKAGIAPLMAKEFGCHKFPMEEDGPNINKLGCVDGQMVGEHLIVNAYTQMYPRGEPAIDYDALKLCLRKIAALYRGSVLMPAIGCGLAKGNPFVIFPIIEQELPDATVVVLDNNIINNYKNLTKRKF